MENKKLKNEIKHYWFNELDAVRETNISIMQFLDLCEHFYNLALEDVKEKVKELMGALNKQNPNPLGTTTQCLASAEVMALDTVLDSINELVEPIK